MKIGRREFIKYAGGTVGLWFLGRLAVPFPLRATAEEARNKTAGSASTKLVDGFGTVADGANRFGMVIDVGACIGCRRCVWACKAENNIPDTVSPRWIEVFQMEAKIGVTGYHSAEDLRNGATTDFTQSPQQGKWYLPAQCYHCGNPPCLKVCPTGATYQDRDGLVLMDYERCIGCRLCVVACPYSARRFNWWQGQLEPEGVNPLVPPRPIGVVEKCTFCVHRVRRGRLPRCVEVCPVQARHFGNVKDPQSTVSQLLEANLSFRLFEEHGTNPHIWYITRGRKWISD